MAESDIEQKALDLLSMREHSKLELSRKLVKRGFEMEAVNEVLDRLEARKFLSEARFAESYLAHRAKSGHGPVRIRLELKDRGVSERDIDDALTACEYDFFALAAHVLEKKFGTMPLDGLKERQKAIRFLEYRGFEQAQIRYAVEHEDE